jgi:hypothetical protein
MYRNRNNNSWIWFVFLFFIFFGGGSVFTTLLPLIIILAVVIGIAVAAVKSGNKTSQGRNSSYERGYRRANGGFAGSRRYSSAQMAKINIYLRRWYRQHTDLELGSGITLRLHGQRYASLSSLDVYRNGTMICSLSDFGRRYPDSYDEIIHSLSDLARQPVDEKEDIFDAEVHDHHEEAPKQTEEEPAEKGAQYFIDTINSLNNDIPDEEISNGLFETTSLLKQIQDLEVKFPKSKPKLNKLYEYYLPILVRILRQFENLQNVKQDPSYEETRGKLARTIRLINDAMKTIIQSMTDADFINLSADISTLEAVLRKDGLTEDGVMKQTKEGNTDE